MTQRTEGKFDATVVRLEPVRAGLRPALPADYACCGNCRYWMSPTFWQGTAADDTPGNCHRHAPAPVREDCDGWRLDRYWPGTYISNWCGEHEMLDRCEPHNASR